MIDFTHPTKLSRMASIIAFVGIIPALSFYVGLEYMLTQHMVVSAQESVAPVAIQRCPCDASR